jgi:hypothetical protein
VALYQLSYFRKQRTSINSDADANVHHLIKLSRKKE